MATLFTRIIDGELPGRFVWADDVCVVLLTIEPITNGHAMVVPRTEVTQWLDASDELMARLVSVARRVGTAQLEEFGGERAGLLVEGYGVPHLHVHVWPTSSPADFDVHRVQRDLPAAVLDEHAARLRDRLASQGHALEVAEALELS
ncbi:histidine triad (HIT) protein [Beutenbergia cavernae DSM 12333]|uniref:Histidine triad (HIT) protein n=1 Tax=Beutenbergia cavernae (strain ATCC BAA-8 / DSM 12333 / CCUG 43141 / JCM 11478 / NBRC 16432 / NCIMB 13614 / HKI 0122) TaxID=471853 RepID=C5C5N4_BEUC1|nr:HIT family protein [Beutenbergia cavernae]ACQ80225.1 histidine triad (HIT) protein [Beutenbergia cavernae DSM 12333]